MSIHTIFLMITVFLASAVEVVEMATIVLGVGLTRGWASTFFGGGAGLIVLAAIVGVLGPLLTLVPINLLRLIVGILLLLFGLQWLRKSVFRISRSGFAGGGQDEEEEAEEEASEAGEKPLGQRVDWTAFTLSFKGVFLEGMEIAFIVVTFGAAAGRVGLAAVAAGAAFVLIAGISVAARAALKGIPGNVIKYAVGILLTTYGTFWAVRGMLVPWPGGDLAILGLLVLYTAFSLGAIAVVRRTAPQGALTGEEE